MMLLIPITCAAILLLFLINYIYKNVNIWKEKRKAAKAWAALSVLEKIAYSKFPLGTAIYDRKTAVIVRMDYDLCYLVATTKDRFRLAFGGEVTLLGNSEIVTGVISPDYIGYSNFKPDLEAIEKLKNEEKA